MVEVKRTVRVTTEQHVLKDVAPVQTGFPMREWSIQVSLVNDKGQEVPATIFDKVTYHLHPTFSNPVRSFKKPPFTIQEQGWGGFDIPITLTLSDKGGDKKLNHDLNFLKEKYVIDRTISINTNKPNLLKELAKSGPIPNVNNGGNNAVDNVDLGIVNNNSINNDISSPSVTKRKTIAGNTNNIADTKNVKRVKTGAVKGGVDLEKMADYLTKLNEDDLLGVVQMINDNRTPDMSIKNDVDNGEFTMDLYTLPDTLLKSLWDYVKKRAE